MANPTYNLLETLSSYCICKYNDFIGARNKTLGGHIIWVLWRCHDWGVSSENEILKGMWGSFLVVFVRFFRLLVGPHRRKGPNLWQK